MKVFWTKYALDALSEVYYYYRNNVNVNIASNIRYSILSSTNQLEKFPQSGQTEELLMDLEEGHRYIIRGNYKIIYKVKNNKVYITDVFDTRQNPERINRRNK